MIERFKFELFHCNGGDMTPDAEGEYVSYEDYAALQQKLDALEDKLRIKQNHIRLRDSYIEELEAREPVVDADYLNSVRAEAVNHAGKMIMTIMNHQDKGVERALECIAEVEMQYSLRSGTHDTADKAG